MKRRGRKKKAVKEPAEPKFEEFIPPKQKRGLSPEDEKNLIADHRSGNFTAVALSKKYKVSLPTIYSRVKGAIKSAPPATTGRPIFKYECDAGHTFQSVEPDVDECPMPNCGSLNLSYVDP